MIKETMKNSLRRKLFKLFAALLIVVVAFPFVSTTSKAGNLTAMSDTMTRLAASQASNHLISFTFTSGTAVIENETITITFASGFDLTTIDCGDIDITDDGVDEDVQENAGSCTANATEWGVGVSGQVITLTAPSTSATYINGSSVVTVEIGTNATADEAGDEQITNPTAGNKTISIGGSFGDTGTLAVPILSTDQVTVTATVDPTISVAYSGTGQPTCALGTISAGTISVCSYTTSVTTNAGSGYVSTIVDSNSTTAGKLCSPSTVTCTNDINVAAGDNDVDPTAEEYGVGTSKAGQTITQYTTCANNNPQPAKAISTTPQQYANATGPIDSDGTTLCHAASITGTTPSGSYSHVVTHITTGTF